jgi:hypothetical protein
MPKMTTGNLTIESYEAWRLFARARGVTVTGLLEALGRRLANMDQPDARLPPLLRDAVMEARTIDDDRRRR